MQTLLLNPAVWIVLSIFAYNLPNIVHRLRMEEKIDKRAQSTAQGILIAYIIISVSSFVGMFLLALPSTIQATWH